MMNYPPRPYTKKLLDKGLIKFYENDKNEYKGVTTKFVTYVPEDDYTILSNGQNVEFFHEWYIDDKFKKFTVVFYDPNWEEEDVKDSEQLTFYKREYVN